MTTRLRVAGIILATVLCAAIPASRRTAHASLFSDDSLQQATRTTPDSAAALDRLIADINALLSLPEARSGKVGVEIRSLTANRVLFQLNADNPLTPASTTKVVTAFTALSELGPSYQVRTILAGDARVQDGVLKGNLYVKGFGDPFLSINDIDVLVDKLVNSGVKTIEGNIVGDGSFFDNKTERTQYSGDADVVVPLPPIAALTLPGGTFKLIVSSSRIAGVPCNVQTYPSSSGIEIVNTAVTATPAPARRSGGKKRGRRADLMLPDAGSVPLKADAEDPVFNEDAERFGDEVPHYEVPLNEQKPRKRTQASPAPKKGATSTARKGAAAGKKTTARKGSTAKNTAAGKSTRKGAASQPTASKRTKAGTPRTAAVKQTKPAQRTTAQRKAPERREPAATANEATTIARGPIKVTMTTDENGKQKIMVSGSLAPNKTVSYRYTMKNPPLVIAGIVHDRLRSHGITINGTVTAGVTPAKHRLLAETGRPLREILQSVMKNSNNFLAEYVFKMIGAAAGGQQETAQHTVQKIQQRMSIGQVPFGRCIINDGSGLSRANCLTASALATILDVAHSDRKIFDQFYGVMSVAGVDGTLRNRMRGTFAERNVHGKTGTLRNVSALAGYVTTRDGDLLCFSMLMNGGNHGAYRSVQDRVAARLAAFSYKDIPPPLPATKTGKK